jgi:hypothetical protein
MLPAASMTRTFETIEKWMMQRNSTSEASSGESVGEVGVPLQGRWIGTDNVVFKQTDFENAFQERLDRKNPRPPSISKVEMLDGYVLQENLKIKPERMCIVEFRTGADAAIALSVQFVHVIVADADGIKKAYLVSLSVPGHNLVMQSVYSFIWTHLLRLDAVNEELKVIGAIRLSGLKEPNLSSNWALKKWYRKELIKAGKALRLGGSSEMVVRKFLVASYPSSKTASLKLQVLELHREECLILAILRQLQANGIVFEFELPYEI